MSATITSKNNEMPQAQEQAMQSERATISKLDFDDEAAKARKAEKEAFRQLDVVKARNYDLESQRVDLNAKLSTANDEIESLKGEVREAQEDTMQVEKQLADARNIMATMEKARMDLEDELSTQRDQSADLMTRYRNRLADIAELGHAIARSENQLHRLQAQHEYTVLRHHIMQSLAPVMGKLHKNLSGPSFSRARHRNQRQLAKDSALIASSGLFDAEWYLELYPDVANGGIDPLKHYVLHGAYEVRDPGPMFSAFKYHKANPDVTEAGIPALLHYLRNGRNEGRRAYKVGEEA